MSRKQESVTSARWNEYCAKLS